jgi:16S rRNA processing protein RimM
VPHDRSDPAGGLVPLGVVSGAWGVRGWVRVTPFADEGEVLQQVTNWWLLAGEGPQRLQVQAVRRHGATLIAQWEGLASKEAADALKGTRVAVARSEFPTLPAGEHYLADLIGKRVVNREGVELGQVVGLREAGPAQWLEVNDGHQTRLIPLVGQYLDEIDDEAQVIRVDWQEQW